jgi:hypothetical protein
LLSRISRAMPFLSTIRPALSRGGGTGYAPEPSLA